MATFFLSMRILAAGDFHIKQSRMKRFIEINKDIKPDLSVICGDITSFGPAEAAKEFLDSIPGKVLAIPGNLDPIAVNEAVVESKAIFLHEKKVEEGGYTFIGLGGSLPGIFSYQEYQEDEIEEILEGLRPDPLSRNAILVTHMPPYGIKDLARSGKHLGSRAIRKWIEKYQPQVVLCSHVHEDPGYELSSQTWVVNCSIGLKGEASLVEFVGTGEIKIKQIG
jgi:hypothetical protein